MTTVLLGGMFVLIIINAFFVAAEFALVRARRSRLEALSDGDAKAKLALEEMSEISEYLSACQLGVTFASIGIGFLGEPAVADLIHPWLGGALSHGLALAISLVVAYVLTTALHITIGEQVPKLFAIARAERIARSVARPLYWFTKAFRPFVAVLNGVSNAILRMLRVDPSAAFDEGGTPEDLRLLIAQSLEGGQLEPEEALMLSGVFELHESQARHVMTPTARVVTVDITSDAGTASERCIQSGHTRLIVTEGHSPDRVKGVIHANSLLRLILAESPAARIDSTVRDALIVPETQPLDTLLADLRRTHNSLAVVVDEYGRTAGIVSIEDIVEEIVGEISDETDPSSGPVREISASEWLARGDVALADLRDYGIELDGDTTAFTSLGGLVLDRLGHLPRVGELVSAHGYVLHVESVRDSRVELVRISRADAESSGENSAENQGKNST
jgi:CBS domain containing-hemolysin-like protein